MYKFTPTDLESISNLRELYFTEIKYPQELMLEWMVADGKYFKIIDIESEIGYFIKSEEDDLLEFYLTYSSLNNKEDIFREILTQQKINTVWCKTFDYILMTCAHTFCKSSKITGTIFRDYTPDLPVNIDSNFEIRTAQKSDIPLLKSHKSDLYESVDELYMMVDKQYILMFEKNNELYGCGFFIKILTDKNYYDIGMWVNPAYRNKGYAAQIISYLKKQCFNNGYIPVCGCAADNTASRKTLEKNGFTSKYSIITFKI